MLHIFKNNVIGTVFVSFWSVFLLFFGLSCMTRPTYSVTFTYPHHKINGVALDQAAFYCFSVGLTCIMIGCYGLYALRKRQDLRSAILIFCIMTLGGSFGDVYQLYHQKYLGSSTIFSLSSVNFQLVSFIGGLCAYFALPKENIQRRTQVPPLVKYFFGITGLYSLLTALPGVLYPPGSVAALFSFTSKDSQQVSQVSLFSWLLNFYVCILSLISLSAIYSPPDPTLVIGFIVDYIIGMGTNIYLLAKRSEMHVNLPLPLSMIGINACLAIFGLVVLRDILPQVSEVRIERKSVEAAKQAGTKADIAEPVKGETTKVPEHKNLQHRATEQIK